MDGSRIVLRPHLPPGAGETPTSLLSRHANLHGRRLPGFCRDLSLHLQGIVDGFALALAALARIVGVDSAPLEAEAMRKVGGRRYEHKGEIVTSAVLSRATKRICPLCVAEDVEGAGGDRHAAHHAYGRSLWLLDPIRSCPRHGVALVAVASGTSPWEAHDFAGAVVPLVGDLDALRSLARPVEASPMEGYLRGRLEGRRGSGFLDKLAWHAAADACQTIGAVAAFGRDAPLFARSDREWREAGDAGFVVASGGEAAIRAFLSELDRSYAGTRHATDGPQARYGNLHRRLAGTLDETDLDPLRDVVFRHVVETTPVGPGDTVLGRPVTRRVVHSIRSASLAFDVHPKRLRKILAAKGTVGEEAEGEPDERAVFPASEGNLVLLKDVAEALSLEEVAAHLGTGRVQTKLLVDAGIVAPFVALPAVKGSDKNFAKRDLDEFLRRLTAVAVPVAEAPDGAHTIPDAARRAHCGAAEIVAAITGGRLSWVGKLEGAEGYMSVLVDLAEIKRLVRGPPRTALTARDVEKRLRTSTRTVSALIENGVLPTSTIVNPVNRCPTRVVDDGDVAAFERDYVSLNGLSAERGKHFRVLQKGLSDAGVRPALNRDTYHATFYRRADL